MAWYSVKAQGQLYLTLPFTFRVLCSKIVGDVGFF